MTSRLFIIASFVLVTTLTTGRVELFCRSLDQALTVAPSPPKSTSAVPAQTSTVTKDSGLLKTTVPRKNGQDYAIIIKRGLFGKDQEKKPEATPAPSPVLKATSLNLTLLGTISGDGSAQRAIIQDKRTKTQDIYQTSDTIGLALIKEIFREKVILTVKGKDEVLLMEERKSPPSTGGRSRHQVATKNHVVEESKPIDKTVNELEDQPEEPEQNPASTYPRRDYFLKKTNNQVVEP